MAPEGRGRERIKRSPTAPSDDCLFADQYRRAMSDAWVEGRYTIRGDGWQSEGRLSRWQVVALLADALAEHKHGESV